MVQGQDRVESVLWSRCVVAIGLGQVAELAHQTHDRGVAQAGEVARQAVRPRPAAVFVIGEVAHVVQAVFDVPVVSDESHQLIGGGDVEHGAPALCEASMSFAALDITPARMVPLYRLQIVMDGPLVVFHRGDDVIDLGTRQPDSVRSPAARAAHQA